MRWIPADHNESTALPIWQIEKCATNQKWLEDNLVRQSERSKNVDPVIQSTEILSRRDDVQFTSAGLMNRPKPKAAKTETPTPAKEEEAKKDDVDMDEGKEVEEDMDVD
jgi:heat shock protein 4